MLLLSRSGGGQNASWKDNVLSKAVKSVTQVPTGDIDLLVQATTLLWAVAQSWGQVKRGICHQVECEEPVNFPSQFAHKR